MTEPALTFSNVSFSYKERPILHRVNLQIEQGAFIGIVGPNGGGKTTLLNLAMGFLEPQEGSILVFGEKPKASRSRIGYVPQMLKTDRQFPITVRELILLGALTRKLFYSAAAKKKAEELMEELELLPYADSPFSTLSGGLAQRALFARALLSDPDLLLLDEPTANIDTASVAKLLERLEALKGKKTILLVTHDLKTIVERVDRMLTVEKQVVSLHPKDVCEHFLLGLYHTPLIDLPANHFPERSHVPPCVLP